MTSLIVGESLRERTLSRVSKNYKKEEIESKNLNNNREIFWKKKRGDKKTWTKKEGKI